MSIWMNVISQLPNLPKRPHATTTRGVAQRPQQQRGRRAWTDEELEFLEREYPVTSNSELVLRLKRCAETIRVQANAMGIKKIFTRNKPPGQLYRSVIERVKAGESHAMIIMTLFVTQEEIDACIRHYERCVDASR